MLLKFLFYSTVFSFFAGQLVKIPGFSENLYLFDVLVGLLALYGAFYFLVIKKKFKTQKNLNFFFIFSFVGLISLLVHGFTLNSAQFMNSALYLVRWGAYLVSAVVVFNMLKAKILSREDVIHAFLYSALLISIAGFIQLALLPDFETLDPSLGWDPHKNRLASTFFDPNFVGGYLCLCLALLFSTRLTKQSFVMFGLPILIALFLTFSRSSWAMFSVIIFVFGVFKYRKWLFLAFLLAFLAYFAVPRVQTRLAGVTDPADSAHFRLISWGNTLKIAKDNLFLGVGFNTFRYAQKDYGFFEVGELGGHSGAGSDSSFLLVLATTGVVGFILFNLGYFSFLGDVRGRLGLTASLLGLFIHSQFVNSLFYPPIMFLWLIILVLFG